jgi:hypothetical protein
MKVLDLQCESQHIFEGWFGSEDDFLFQRERSLVECPICGNASITKRLSAPRLNLTSSRGEPLPLPNVIEPVEPDRSLQTAWLDVSRHIVANTDDVGSQFAEEARKIHYGEIPERAIRGQASQQETESLIEEGITVIPLLLPDALKGPLQ